MKRLSLQMLALAGSETWKGVSETDFQYAVKEHAEADGWAVMSWRKSASPGKDGRWRGLAAPGWPDLILVKGKRLLAVELKSEKGHVTPAQRRWLKLLNGAGAESYIARPRDAAELIGILRG